MLFKRKADKNGNGGSQFYWYKFKHKGQVYVKSTKVCNLKEAQQIENAAKVNVARQAVGLPSNKACPLLCQFIERQFLPFIEKRHADQPNTLRYYRDGANHLKDGALGSVPLDVMTGKQIAAYALRQRSKGGKDGNGLQVSSVNADLRTLRRIFHLAEKDGDLQVEGFNGVPPKIKMLPGENRRNRALTMTEAEEEAYLKAAPPLLKDVATLLFDLGLRPDEVYRLRHDQFSDGWVTVEGKSKEARRLPCSPRVLAIVKARATGSPWVFPCEGRKPTASGHIEESSIKKQHAKALKNSKVAPFVRYDIRHCWNTRLAQDPNVSAAVHQKAAGHQNFQTTLRYIHLNNAALEVVRVNK
jgi:integrase